MVMFDCKNHDICPVRIRAASSGGASHVIPSEAKELLRSAPHTACAAAGRGIFSYKLWVMIAFGELWALRAFSVAPPQLTELREGLRGFGGYEVSNKVKETSA